MKCPVCGIEMKKETATEWVCRNGKCVRGKAAKRGTKATSSAPGGAPSPQGEGVNNEGGNE